MAKKKVVVPTQLLYFNCKSCSEMTHFNNEMICNLRIKLDKDGIPNGSCRCDEISICNFYRKVKGLE